MAIIHQVAVNNGPFIYLDAREEYLTPDQARALAVSLLAHAADAERAPVDDWPNETPPRI